MFIIYHWKCRYVIKSVGVLMFVLSAAPNIRHTLNSSSTYLACVLKLLLILHFLYVVFFTVQSRTIKSFFRYNIYINLFVCNKNGKPSSKYWYSFFLVSYGCLVYACITLKKIILRVVILSSNFCDLLFQKEISILNHFYIQQVKRYTVDEKFLE